MVSAAYQGSPGAFTDILLKRHFGGRGEEVETVAVPTLRDVAAALVTGRARYGLFPVESAIGGSYRDGFEPIMHYELRPVREIFYRMDHRLLGVRGATVQGVRRILSHPMVLRECSRFLGSLAAAKPVPSSDGGSAAREVAELADPTVAAISSPEAAALYGLVELAANIVDTPENDARFLLVEAGRPGEITASETANRCTSVVFSTRNEQGALAQCLGVIAMAGINVIRLESQPKAGRAFEYVFFADLACDASAPALVDAVGKLRALSNEVRVIGSYDVGAPDVRKDVEVASRADEAFEKKAAPMPAGAAKSWPKAAKPTRPGGTRVPIGDVVIGGDDFVVIAGPCSVESRQQVVETAHAVQARGARLLRGGAFKPRTNPYAFQGLGWEGVDLLAEAGRITGMPTVSEVMSVDQVERMALSVDVLQVGARNMQNFDLLKALGRCKRPILLKRGLSATIDELLAAAEYILAEGNPDVILCERGIRTFETATRNTLDLSAVPVLRERTHLPILVDPSHGVGVRRWIRPLARASKVVGAHGILVEVHPNPPEAKSDADQALTYDDFAAIMQDLENLPSFEA